MSPAGSSPRMWGTLHGQIELGFCRRFIPTHVGNTPKAFAPCECQTVHPHACGEHKIIFRVVYDIDGSSPRMWGTHPVSLFFSFPRRFIPTHVGNTINQYLGLVVCTVHPHACGEHIYYRYILSNIFGSSPRMWGTQLQMVNDGKTVRFIPTHVGNTICQFVCKLRPSVHPHACGEHMR